MMIKSLVFALGLCILANNSSSGQGSRKDDLLTEIQKHEAALATLKGLTKQAQEKLDACTLALHTVTFTEIKNRALAKAAMQAEEDAAREAAVAARLESLDQSLPYKRIQKYGDDVLNGGPFVGTRLYSTILSGGKSAIFERVKRPYFDEAWQEINVDEKGSETKGLIWSSPISEGNKVEFLLSEAIELCKKIGASLPTDEQLAQLNAKFDSFIESVGIFTPLGREEYGRLFPNRKNLKIDPWFWISSASPSVFARGFGSVTMRPNKAENQVICVSAP